MHDRYFYKQTNNQYNTLVNKTNLDKLFNCDLISIHSMEYLKKKKPTERNKTRIWNLF